MFVQLIAPIMFGLVQLIAQMSGFEPTTLAANLLRRSGGSAEAGPEAQQL
jgi:hypothetical protein